MQQTKLLPEFKTAPAVFAVGREYQIKVPVKSDLLFWVTVGDRTFYDHTNGIMRSAVRVHTVTVPSALLDAVGSYTVHYRKVIERLPYFPTSEDAVSQAYRFRPVPTDRDLRLYHIADTHGALDLPVAAARAAGEIDLLILNGDIPNHSGDLANFDLIYQLCDALTGGEIPVVFSRGNHDMRGICAEQITDYAPTAGGCSYFTFRVGSLWGLVLDCGEDKPESHEAYGFTNVSHVMRQAELDFIKDVIAREDEEYKAAGVTHRMVVVHAPFTYSYKEPFNIEEELYRAWTEQIATHIRPDLLLAGHLHYCEVRPEGGERDEKKAIPVVVGSRITRKDGNATAFAGAALQLKENGVSVQFTNHLGEIEGAAELPLRS